MANQLTLKVMETIVKRCEGYEPLSKNQSNTTYGISSIKPREEALLSAVIHKQPEFLRNEDESRREEHRPTSFSKNGVVSLDALLRELKK